MHPPPSYIDINLTSQSLRYSSSDADYCYQISSALNGPGERHGSGCTPRGWHYIRAHIGAGLPENAVFKARRFTGEIYTSELAQQWPQRDWILSRILWLSGCEVGFNRMGDVDTQRRYIYIHGTPDTEPMGTPLSHGCIRMRNRDIIQLFAVIPKGVRVHIHE
ncbi:MAG: L,D-transpeptidase [Hahellaceae bacterium]|nr:L,D-transpeptidase [Hahellaceae bacterium]